MKGHKQAAFHVRFIEKPVLEHGVVSQQYNVNAAYESKQWIVDTQDIVTVNQSAGIITRLMRRIRKTLKDNSSPL